MIAPLSFFVEGNPHPKQSFKIGRAGGRVVGFTPARVKSWQEDVAWRAQLCMRALGLDPLKGTVTVDLTFFLADARRQDCDNLSKAILDSLNKITWADDKQAIDLHIHKYICRQRQGVLIEISESDRDVEISEKQLEHILFQHAPGYAVVIGATA